MLRRAVVSAMGLQIAIAVVWMACNVAVLPWFGDAVEYVELSKSLEVDEYRPILYPLFIRGVRWLENRTEIPYQSFAYFFQALVSFACVFTTLRTIRGLLGDRLDPSVASSQGFLLLASLYAWTFPMIGFMAFAGMTDSLALSATLFFLSALLLLLFRENPERIVWPQLCSAFVAGSLVRGDRPWLFLVSGTAMALLLLALRRIRFRRGLSVVATLLLSFAAVSAVDRATQKPGCRGRPKTDLSFVLLDRVVWPHMRECYYDFPPEVRQVVSLRESKKFDANNNNVMYRFAPMVEKAVGRERAEELYRTMARTVFRSRTKRVLLDISHDVAKPCLAPFFQAAEVYRVSCHGKERPCIEPYCYNPRCMARKTPFLTRLLNAGGLHLFVLLFLGSAAWRVRTGTLLPAIRTAGPVLLAFFGFSLVLALFYGLGDGAHPNSRYSIPVDFAWVVALLLLLSVRTGERHPETRADRSPPVTSREGGTTCGRTGRGRRF